MSSIISNSIDDRNKRRILEIARIVLKMEAEGLSQDFILQVFCLADKYQGVLDLLNLWIRETDQKEKDEIIADLQDEIEELQGGEVVKPRYLQFDNLEVIAKNIMEFKKSLRVEVDRWGGISRLSKETGIPIASLSRFFSTPSLPRRVTLEKIARAMRLKESDLLSKWSA